MVLTSGSSVDKILTCKQRIAWMISFAMTYAGAAFAPKKHVIGVDGFLSALDFQSTYG